MNKNTYNIYIKMIAAIIYILTDSLYYSMHAVLTRYIRDGRCYECWILPNLSFICKHIRNAYCRSVVPYEVWESIRGTMQFFCFVLFPFLSLQINLTLYCIVAVQQLGKPSSSSQNGLCHSYAPRSASINLGHYRLLRMEEHNLHV